MKNKIKVIDAETGEYISMDESTSRRGARSKTQLQKDTLINYLLYGKKETYFLSTDFFVQDKEFIDLCLNFALGTLRDLFFFAKAISYTREMTYESSYSILALYLLSCSHHPEAKRYFQRIFDKIILDEKDLQLFVEIVRTKQLRGFGKLYQHAVQRWVNRLTSKELLDFYCRTAEIQKPHFALKDIIKYCHIKSNDLEKQAIYDFIISKKQSRKLPPDFIAADRLFQLMVIFTNQQIKEEKEKLVKENNIPLSLAVMLNCDSTAISEVVKRSTLSEILKHLIQITTRSGWTDRKAIAHFSELLRNKEIVLNCGFSPFSLIMLLDSCQTLPAALYESMTRAIDILIENIQKADKSIAVFVDQASTFGQNSINSAVSDQSMVNTIASYFYFVSNRVSIIPFDNKVKPIAPAQDSNILSVTEQISSLGRPAEIRWGTPFKYLLETQTKYDYLIFITAKVPWRKVLIETEAGTYMSRYFNEVNPSAKAFFIDILPNNDNRVSHGLNNTFLIDGFNVNSSRFILEHIYDKIEQQRDLIERSLITR